MRKQWLFFLLLYTSANVYSQHNLSGSRKTSYYTYIYRISAAETINLFTSDMRTANEKLLHTLVDSFPANEEVPQHIPDGNYLFVHAEDNHLVYDLKTFGDVQCKVVNNSRDLAMALHTKPGQPITDAAVFINSRRMHYDDATNTYRVNRRKKSGLLKVNYNGTVHLFPLAKNKQANYGPAGFFNKLSRTFPIKYIARPLKKLFNRNNYSHNNFYWQTAYENKFTGFMVFSKPKYKPGDTVQLKAFVMNRHGKPVNRPLLVRLSEQRSDGDTILTTLYPFRPGGYEYQFAITDSLDLTLDTQALITLEELKSKKYNLDEYDGDLDDDEYLAKRKVVMRGRFTYEEYELGRLHFTARADKETHHRGYPVAVYLKATDENDMGVLDGRVQLLITTNTNGNELFHAPKVFLPDTLWSFSQQLEPLGETKIIIPDSIFPAVSFGYRATCTLLNGDNEYKTVTLIQSYKDNRHQIYFTPYNDSLKIEQRAGENRETVYANVYAINDKDDTIQQHQLQLPASIRINPYAKYYSAETDSAENEYELKQTKGMVSCLAARTSDSINIQAVNPQHIPFWYSIFAGNRIINRGYGDSLSYREKTHTSKNYFISLQYVYGNKVWNEEYTIPFQDKLLNIEVSQPEFVYPGQQVAIDIYVSSKSGKAVENADVTAYSITDKFENQRPPFVPYLGKIYPRRKHYSDFYPENEEDKSGTSKLNWERWSREMGLDSIEYFQFLHPATVYANTEPAADSITQLAPFVVVNGDIKPVHQVYIDEVPYFFSQAQQLQRYSFKVEPGKHALRLRTNNQLIRIDSVWAFKGVKTFISINADSTADIRISKVKMPDSLNNYEKALWSKYMLLVQNNFGEAPATITQSNLLYLLNLKDNKVIEYPQNILAGPFPNLFSNLVVKNKFTQSFESEGNYLFDISPGLIKQKQLPNGKYSFSPFLSADRPLYNFHDFVLTQKEVDSLWQNYLDFRSAGENLFRNTMLNKTGNGQLRIAVDKDANGNLPFIKNVLLFRNDDVDFVRVYSGSSVDLGFIQPGIYRILFLLKNDAYYIRDSIEIKKDGINFYRTGEIIPVKRDSVSTRIGAIINGREKKWRSVYQENDLDIIKESFNERYLDAASFSRYISGKVRDAKDGSPVPGVSITIKGTKFGTITDQHGFFTLKVPEKGTIVVASVGYEQIEKRMTAEPDYDIKLRAVSSALNEVVVVGYGTQLKKSLTGSVSVVSAENMLAGKVSGLQITLRGASSITQDNEPLIIVDGLPFSGRLDTTTVASVQVLKSAEATAHYGSRGANGVIIIVTKKGSTNNAPVAEEILPLPGNVLRHNFSDAAWWQPRLRTDAHGKASFTTTLPDDITKWRTFVIAMGNNEQTGFAEGFIKSFKAISANISMPAFAVEGDSLNMIGKVLNYTIDSIQVKRNIHINNALLKEGIVVLRNSFIDTIAVTANQDDSLKLKYTVHKEDGYFDGEERAIPVFKQGVLETKGFFASLDTDTVFSISFDTTAGKVNLYAESSVLPVLLDEIENIGRYEYLCNEQLASKLTALLLKKKVYGYLKKEFSEEKNINNIISKLNQSKSQAGLWGWWNNNEPLLWVSLHVTEALLMAGQEGYKININKEVARDYLVYNFERNTVADKISALRLLKAMDAKVDFKKYADTLDRKMPSMTLYEHLQFLQLKQQLALPIVFDTLMGNYKNTMFGNMYWGEENNRFFDNPVQNTLLMYRLMKSAGGYEKELQKIRNYFLEKRKDGRWRNTYESSMILATILPDIIKNDILPQPATITINSQPAVSSFPYTAEIVNTDKLVIKKQGNWPVYFTAYQQYWNHEPAKVSADFTVNSFFERNAAKIATIKAGEPVTMKAVVDVRADADYVMIEIPIPAGCSYKEKNQQYFNNEVHREYFRNKVSIFCTSLRKGQYTFNVFLLPRYTGTYHLNPAKAEMMYFPVFYGRESQKKIKIE